MAIRRKRRTRDQDQDVDPLGGFTLEQLMGLDPVSEVEDKPNPVVKLVGFPFKLVGLPVKVAAGVARLPFRLLGALVPKRLRGERQGD